VDFGVGQLPEQEMPESCIHTGGSQQIRIHLPLTVCSWPASGFIIAPGIELTRATASAKPPRPPGPAPAGPP